jgi:hypothetical protein
VWLYPFPFSKRKSHFPSHLLLPSPLRADALWGHRRKSQQQRVITELTPVSGSHRSNWHLLNPHYVPGTNQAPRSCLNAAKESRRQFRNPGDLLRLASEFLRCEATRQVSSVHSAK